MTSAQRTLAVGPLAYAVPVVRELPPRPPEPPHVAADW